jgi:tripeptidyl-peptidase I
MLDLDVAYPVIYPQNVRLFSVDDFHYDNVQFTNGYFNTFLDALDGSYCTRTAFNETGDDPKFDPVYPDPHGYNHTEMCGVFKSTNVISISYSPNEVDRTVNYDRRQCSEWMKLGLQGVTVVGATGDTGVSGNGGFCLKDQNGNSTVFAPLTLTNCPYVVAVGSTVLPAGAATDAKNEIATESFGSSKSFYRIST